MYLLYIHTFIPRNEVINNIIDKYTNNEKGVRNLKRCLEIIYSKLNLYRLMKEGSSLFNKEETLKVEFYCNNGIISIIKTTVA